MVISYKTRYSLRSKYNQVEINKVNNIKENSRSLKKPTYTGKINQIYTISNGCEAKVRKRRTIFFLDNKDSKEYFPKNQNKLATVKRIIHKNLSENIMTPRKNNQYLLRSKKNIDIFQNLNTVKSLTSDNLTKYAIKECKVCLEPLKEEKIYNYKNKLLSKNIVISFNKKEQNEAILNKNIKLKEIKSIHDESGKIRSIKIHNSKNNTNENIVNDINQNIEAIVKLKNSCGKIMAPREKVSYLLRNQKRIIPQKLNLLEQLSIDNLKIFYNIKECQVLLYKLTELDIINYKKSISNFVDYNEKFQNEVQSDKIMHAEEINLSDNFELKTICLNMINNSLNEDNKTLNIKLSKNMKIKNILSSNEIDISKNGNTFNSINYIFDNGSKNLLINENEMTPANINVNVKDISFKLPFANSNSYDSNILTPVYRKINDYKNVSSNNILSMNKSTLHKSRTKILISDLTYKENDNKNMLSYTNSSKNINSLYINQTKNLFLCSTDNYEMTPLIHKIPSKATIENYNIDNLSFGDSTDDECSPKKKIPLWASNELLLESFKHQSIEPPENFNLNLKENIIDINNDLNQCFKIDKKWKNHKRR